MSSTINSVNAFPENSFKLVVRFVVAFYDIIINSKLQFIYEYTLSIQI